MGKGRHTRSGDWEPPCSARTSPTDDGPIALNRTLLPRAKRRGGKKAAQTHCCVGVLPPASPSCLPPSFLLRSAEIESLRLGDFSGPSREEGEEEREGVFVREVGLDRVCGGVSYVRPRPRRQRKTASHSVTISGKSAANWPLKRLAPTPPLPPAPATASE